MGHPANVVFYDADRAQVSPVVYCDYGGESLLRDLRRVVRDARTFGAAEMALDLAVRWALEYGRHAVAVHNLDTPGLTAEMTPADVCQAALDYALEKVGSGGGWVLVLVADLTAVGKDGEWPLDGEGRE